MKIILIIFLVIIIIDVVFLCILFHYGKSKTMHKVSDDEYKEFQEYINNLKQRK